MILIACVDDNLGMMFNKRRQSRDIKVNEHIKNIVKDKKIWINPYSKELFNDVENILIDEQSTEKAQNGDYCFIENEELQTNNDKIEKIILYFWNRSYPSDKKFTIDLSEWEEISEEEFEGNSHEKITQKIYIRRNTKCQEKVIQVKRKLENKPRQLYRSLLS